MVKTVTRKSGKNPGEMRVLVSGMRVLVQRRERSPAVRGPIMTALDELNPGGAAGLNCRQHDSSEIVSYLRRRGRDAWSESPASDSFASIFPNDVVSPAERADTRAFARGNGDRRTEPTCR